jgi:hypothetical protein
MEIWFWYILKSAACLSIFYVLYLVIFRKDTNFQLLRLYLLSSILISLILPLSRVSIGLPVLHTHPDKTEIRNIPFLKTIQETPPAALEEVKPQAEIIQNPSAITVQRSIDGYLILKIIYLAVAGFLLLRLLLAVLKIQLLIIHSSKVYRGGKPFYYSEQISSSFSFFSYVFVSRDLQYKPELEKILIHENIHVAQYHTLDLMLVELLSAVMWFNPVVWMLRKTLQQLHEYLADEGVLDTGFDRREYQALLLNHAAEDRLILSSSFNQSLIKKRIVMMTNRNMNSGTKLKILALVPITAVLFLGISSTNGQSPKADTPTLLAKRQTIQLEIPSATDKFDNKLVALQTPEKEIDPTKSNTGDVEKNTATTATKEPQREKSVEVLDEVTSAAPTRMNVFYIGVDNPVEIAVSGVDDSKVFATIDNGSITKEDKTWIVRVSKGPSAIISIYKISDQGQYPDSKKLLSKKQFRVKRVPDPVANVGGVSFGKIEKAKLLTESEVSAELKDFDFDARFVVKAFKLSVFLHGFNQFGHSESNNLTTTQKELISKLNSGDKVLFCDIVAIGPDSIPRNLNAIQLTIQ